MRHHPCLYILSGAPRECIQLETLGARSRRTPTVRAVPCCTKAFQRGCRRNDLDVRDLHLLVVAQPFSCAANPLRAAHEIPNYPNSRSTRNPEEHEVDCAAEFHRYSLKTMTSWIKKQSQGSAAKRNLHAAYPRADFQDALPGQARRASETNISFALTDVTAVTAVLPHQNGLQAAKNAACNRCYRISPFLKMVVTLSSEFFRNKSFR